MVKWTGDPKNLRFKLERKEQELIDAGEEIVTGVVERAKDTQIQTLRDATTKTGFERMEKGIGNGPGRDKTGHMIEEISSEVHREGNKIVGSWGWDDPEYFAAQDFGTARIPAANSLHTSFLAAREDLIRSVEAAVKGD